MINYRLTWLLLLIVLPIVAMSQTYSKKTYTSFNYTSVKAGATDYLYTRSSGLDQCSRGEVYSANLWIKAGLGEEYGKIANEAGQLTVNVTVKGYTNFDCSGTEVVSYTRALVIDKDQPEKLEQIDIRDLFTTVNAFKVSVSAGGLFTYQKNKDVFKAEAYFEDDQAAWNNTAPAASSVSVLNSGNGPVRFTWTTHCAEIKNYQIQLMRLYNTSSGTLGETTITALPDWSEALTLETGSSQTSIDLTLAEGSGYYAWRVRPISNRYPGGITDPRNWGEWSTSITFSPGVPVEINAGMISASLFFYNQFDAEKNFIYSRVFVEGDPNGGSQVRVGEQMTYATALLQTVQTQATGKSDNNVLVSQTVYDYMGRGALSTMATPVSSQSYLGYIPLFAKDADGNLYRASSFDDDNLFRNPKTVDPSCPLGQYYSSSNPDASIPDAEGYPYSRVLYKTDGTGMPMEQSGIGAAHKISSQANRHTTRYRMIGAADAELIPMFGDEAPQSEKVIKSITTDPNNSSSIEYRNEKGQVIATCLAIPDLSENKFDLIDEYQRSLSEIKDTIDSFNETDKGWSAVRTVYFTGESNALEINYKNIWPHFNSEDVCNTLCRQCDYQFRITVDNMGDEVVNVYDTTINVGMLDSCSLFKSLEFHRMLNVGAGEFRVGYSLNTYTLNAGGQLKIDQLADEYRNSLYDKYLASTQGRTQTLQQLMGMLQRGRLDSFYLALNVNPLTAEQVKIALDACDTLKFDIVDCDIASPCSGANPDFEAYFRNYWRGQAALTPSMDTTFLVPANSNYYLGSMQAGDFNALISRMLSDNEVSYNCADLWNIWQGITIGYTSLTEPVPAQYGMSFNLLDYFLGNAGYQFKEFNTNTSLIAQYPYKYFYYVTGSNQACETQVLTGYTPPYTQEVLNSFHNCITNSTSQANLENIFGSPFSTHVWDTIIDQCKDICHSRYENFVSQEIDFLHHYGTYVEGDQYHINWGTQTSGGYYPYTITDTLVSPADVPWTPYWAALCQPNFVLERCLNMCEVDTTNPAGAMAKLDSAMFYQWEWCDIPSTSGQTVLNLLRGRIINIGDSTIDSSYYYNACDVSCSYSGACDTNTTRFLNRYFADYAEQCSPYGSVLDYSDLYQRFPYACPQTDIALYLNPGLADPYFYCSGNNIMVQYKILSANCRTLIALSPAQVMYNVQNGIAMDTCSLTRIYKYSTCTYSFNPVCSYDTLRCLSISPADSITGAETIRPYTCEEIVSSYYINQIQLLLSNLVDGKVQKLRDSYRSNCKYKAHDDEDYSLRYSLGYYHYTLYYYDRAGNLVRTVPPAGVDLGCSTRACHPNHLLVSEYDYNSLQQLVRQQTPDGGETAFRYDAAGRLRFSQNARQAQINAYSYTKYDALSRITEVGELYSGELTPLQLSQSLDNNINNIDFPYDGSASVSKRQLTRTVYSTAAVNVSYYGEKQEYLDNRVSYAYTDEDGNLNSTGDQVYTYYSYDPHGNVKWIVQQQPELGRNYLAYEYDLISGSVLKVRYNEKGADRFFHRYFYDADKRLTRVETSTDGAEWDKDARYSYYKHGPLRRTETGEDKVQGTDYTYTIHGWLKGINSPALTTATDPGADGTGTTTTGSDLYGMALHYYDGDFTRSGVFDSRTNGGNSYNLSGGDLFNGNITAWSMRSADPQTGMAYTGTTGHKYRYDQLNRLKQADFWTYNTTWSDATNNDFDEALSYDKNGNIKKLSRYSTNLGGAMMDSLSYFYEYNPSGRLLNNKLKYVKDQQGDKGQGDLGSQNSGNYTYDAIGNLTKDVSEQIDAIEWNVYGKIKSITRSSGSTKSDLEFRYDATGNRVAKIEKKRDANGLRPQSEWVTTYYVRDAQGNIMADYNRKVVSNTVEYRLGEQPIYGSDRVGVRNNEMIVYSTPYVSGQALGEIPLDNGVKETDKQMLMPLWKYLAEIGVSTELNSSLKKLVALKTTVAAEGKVDTRNNPAGMEVPYAYRNGLGVENIALGAERDGTVSLYCVSAKTANGEAMVKVYKGDHSPLSLNSGIKADPNSQSTLMRVPGSEREWYYFTLYQGKPYMHRIDEESGIKDANVLMDGKYESYGQTMALVSDYGNGPSKLLLRRYNATTGNTHLVAFTIDKNGAGAAQALDSLSSIDAAGVGEIQISPTLSRIAMVNTSKIGLIKKEQIVYWHFNTERTAATDRATAVEQSYWSVFNKRKFNTIDFTGSGNFIYFVEMKSSSLTRDIKRQQIGGSLSTVTTITGAGDVRRGSDGKMYVAAGRYFYTITSPEGTPASSSQVLANGYNGGALAAQPIRIYLPSTGVSSFAREYGQKTYEIKDHLGNVRVTFSDVKNYDPVALSYSASLSSVNNYYSFGSLEPSRTWSSESYRFGFNGKENDNEVKGTGNQQDYGMRIYDPRLGRFLSADPLIVQERKYPWYSPYQFAGNKPIIAVDVDGLEEKVKIDENTYEIRATYVADQKVLDNVDVVLLQQLINDKFNANASNFFDGFQINFQYPSIMSNDHQLDIKAKKIRVIFNITIATTPLCSDDINSGNSRIYSKTGQSLGGKIIMGIPGDQEFIAKDKYGIPIENGVVFAYHSGSTIVLNPVYFDQSYSGFQGLEYLDASHSGIISHEIGHDLGLNHPDGEYPETGTMSPNGGTPNIDEINTIIDDNNKYIIQPNEQYEE